MQIRIPFGQQEILIIDRQHNVEYNVYEKHLNQHKMFSFGVDCMRVSPFPQCVLYKIENIKL